MGRLITLRSKCIHGHQYLRRYFPRSSTLAEPLVFILAKWICRNHSLYPHTRARSGCLEPFFTFPVIAITILRLYTLFIITSRRVRLDDYILLVSVAALVRTEKLVFGVCSK